MTDTPSIPPAEAPQAPANPKKILIAIVFIVGMLLFIFGRLSPCNTLRVAIRAEIMHNGGIAASLLPLMPESTLTRLTTISPDGLSPLQCMKLDLTGETALGSMPAQSKLPSTALMTKAGEAIAGAIQDCREKRLDDTLKTHVASVQCSNAAITAAYATAGYPYMDIIAMFTAKRLDLAAQLDKENLDESDEEDQLTDTMVKMVQAEREHLATQH